jgi:hypothetical protein
LVRARAVVRPAMPPPSMMICIGESDMAVGHVIHRDRSKR